MLRKNAISVCTGPGCKAWDSNDLLSKLKKLSIELKKEVHIIYFAFFSFIFTYAVFLNSQSDLVWHLSVTLDRILFHMSAFFMIFLSLRLRYFCNKFIK